MIPRTVLITGASSGIGRALALEYGRHGAHVALAARRREELTAVAREVEANGGRANVYTVDVSDASAIAEVVKSADRDLGSLDMVVANAGVSVAAHATALTWSEVERVLDVNVKGAFATLMAAIPIFMSQQRGQLVGVSSLAGRRGLPFFGPYSASKAALTVFLETLRIELGPMNIRVTDVQPGFVDTPIVLKDQHPTPFMWPSDKAARHIVRRLAKAPPTIAFPRTLAGLTALSELVPAWIWDPVTRVVVAHKPS
ncbi:MAG: Oxidoreductase, short-chain dehydrogenase/reductase family [Myxococcaceae bacterium]|nr:Oxidoreductase, short-chain dehydrogenase/reductase family [Myxococcaceae bacterium]